MSNHFELPLCIDIKPSFWLTSGLYVGHLGAILVLFGVKFVLALKLLIASAILASLLHTIRTYILQKNPHSPVQLLLDVMEEWHLTTANGETREVSLRSGALVHPLLVVLPFSCGMRFPVVILTPDVVDADLFRRLRVRLRYRRSLASETG
ncbi:MAG: hypothetical protein HY356_06635 [Gammaproteobacteria bacterium]|nr:hypothetical protein [Gammaproteobacteria bacterium]